MINITKLEIPLGTNVIHLQASVKSESYYAGVNLSKLEVFTQKGYSTETAIYTKNLTGKSVDITITENFFANTTIYNNLFIIKLTTTGNPTSDTPCGMDNTVTYGAVFRKCDIASQMMNYMKELEYNCEIPKDFIDLLLQYKALKLAIETGNIDKAVYLYKKFFRNGVGGPALPRCKCHG